MAFNCKVQEQLPDSWLFTENICYNGTESMYRKGLDEQKMSVLWTEKIFTETDPEAEIFCQIYGNLINRFLFHWQTDP